MKHFILLLLSLISLSTHATTFHTYHNTRFNYRIDYPNFLTPFGESVNHDGQVIRGKHSELIVWGSYYPKNIHKAFQAAIKHLKNYKITQVIKKNNFFIISGVDASQKVYFKTIYACHKNINMQFYYPNKEKKKWSAIVAHVERSFKYTGKCK